MYAGTEGFFKLSNDRVLSENNYMIVYVLLVILYRIQG